jgi:UDP:flavonoid glycosyltransferase YjiC (YdhE family)
VWHARRHERLGTGVAVRGRHLTPAIDRAIHDPAIHERASRLGEQIRAEDGPAEAADHIHEFINHG